MARSDASLPRWPPWTPSTGDTGQADECTGAKATYNRLAAQFSDEEICIRTFRELELRRIGVEVRRAAIALTLGELTADGLPAEPAPDTVVANWFVDATAALNLMGIETVLPGDPPLGSNPSSYATTTQIYLVRTANSRVAAGHTEQIDALSGLIREFHKADIILNGLQIVPQGDANDQQWALVAVHPAVMSSFAEFLAHKYLTEGWRLE